MLGTQQMASTRATDKLERKRNNTVYGWVFGSDGLMMQMEMQMMMILMILVILMMGRERERCENDKGCESMGSQVLSDEVQVSRGKCSGCGCVKGSRGAVHKSENWKGLPTVLSGGCLVGTLRRERRNHQTEMGGRS